MPPACGFLEPRGFSFPTNILYALHIYRVLPQMPHAVVCDFLMVEKGTHSDSIVTAHWFQANDIIS